MAGSQKNGRKQQLSSVLYILSKTILLLFHHFRPEHQQRLFRCPGILLLPAFIRLQPCYAEPSQKRNAASAQGLFYFFINNGFNVNQANAGKNSMGTVKPGNNSGCS